MEHGMELHRVIRALIAKQQRLAASPNLAVRFQTLCIAATLDKRLKQCTDHEVGNLLFLAQERFHIFEPEFALCYHAITRLLLRP
jgi:hypothetical protein